MVETKRVRRKLLEKAGEAQTKQMLQNNPAIQSRQGKGRKNVRSRSIALLIGDVASLVAFAQIVEQGLSLGKLRPTKNAQPAPETPSQRRRNDRVLPLRERKPFVFLRLPAHFFNCAALPDSFVSRLARPKDVTSKAHGCPTTMGFCVSPCGLTLKNTTDPSNEYGMWRTYGDTALFTEFRSTSGRCP